MLRVDRRGGEGDFATTLAWVGDARIMEIDMCAVAPNAAFFTAPHDASNAAQCTRAGRFRANRTRSGEVGGSG